MKLNKLQIGFLLAAVGLAIFSAIYLRYTWTSTIREVSERALSIGKTSATALYGEMFKQLRGLPSDSGTTAYQSIKTRLTNLRGIDQNIRFVYIYTQRAGKLYFMVDSESVDSKDYSPPGQQYTEASDEYVKPFENGQVSVTKPSTDRWGTWVSVLVPMKDLATNQVKAVFALDYPAHKWNDEAIAHIIQAGYITTALFLLLLAFYLIANTSRKVREGRNRLKSLLASMNDLVFVMNKKLVFLEYYQPRNDKLLIPPEAFIGKSFDKINFPKPAYGIIKKALKQVLQTGEVVATEYSLDLKDGRAWFELHITSLLDGSGKTIGLTCVAHDITKRKTAQEQVLFKTILLEAQSESSIDGILAVDSDNRVILSNERFKEMWKIPQDIVNTKDNAKMLDYVTTQVKDSEAFIDKVKRLYKHKTQKSRDQIGLVDGRHFDRYSSPLIGIRGRNYGRIWFFRDITREKEIDTMKSEFVSVASHQLKTPLAGIKWLSELLLSDKIEKPSRKQKEYLKDIQTNNERMLKLVEDLLDVSHIETGRKFNIEKKKTDIAVLVKESLEANRQPAREKKIKFSLCEDTPKKLLLNVDGDKIKQVFGNLISNAIKYSKDGSKVEIGCKKSKSKIVFSVKDSGIGIPEQQQDKIFQKFFRADNASVQATEGTGLGLYIAKAIVEAHSGKMWFESVEGKGTTFYFSLPD